MERQILHVDVNNAFLSWTAMELLKKDSSLDIRTIPAIIGGDESLRHGIVLAKSMRAKQFGIVTGEPIYQARKKCPEIKVYQGNYTMYQKYSKALYELLLEYTDKIERYSIDECFLDLTTNLIKGESLIAKAKEINKRVKEELGFTVNVGVSSNKLLAKMASDFQKPDRIHTLWKEEIPMKMWNLPIDELFMVGKKTLPKLKTLGIHTIGDMAKTKQELLIKRFGKHGKMMWEYANGIDQAEVCYQKEDPKCIGNAITLPKDVQDMEEVKEILLALCEQVAYRLRKHQQKAYVVNVHITTKEFEKLSHQRKIEEATNITKVIYENALQLLATLMKSRTIRLIGIRADKLVPEEQLQLSFFETKQENKKQEEIEKTVDKLKEKFGYDMVTRAGELKVKKMLNIREEK